MARRNFPPVQDLHVRVAFIPFDAGHRLIQHLARAFDVLQKDIAFAVQKAGQMLFFVVPRTGIQDLIVNICRVGNQSAALIHNELHRHTSLLA